MLLLKNATVYPMTSEKPFTADVLAQDGKIKEIRKDIGANAETIDLTGLNLLPGLIDCHTHVSLNSPGSTGGITESSDPVTPEMSVLHSADGSSLDFKYALRHGFTTLGILPGSGNVVNGIGFAARTWGGSIYEMCVKENIGLKVALGQNPKGSFGRRDRFPGTRMAATFMLNEFLENAREYLDKKERKDKDFKPNKGMEAVIPLLKKEVPLRMHCTHNDMSSSIDAASSLGLPFVIEHAWGSDNYIEEIVQSGGAIAYGPIGGKRSFFESRRFDIHTVAELDRRGVLVALITDSPVLGLDALLHTAEEAVRQGTDVLRALKMITVNPAKIMRIDERLGTVETGKDANFAVFRGVPASDMSADVVYTIGEGKVLYSEKQDKKA